MRRDPRLARTYVSQDQKTVVPHTKTATGQWGVEADTIRPWPGPLKSVWPAYAGRGRMDRQGGHTFGRRPRQSRVHSAGAPTPSAPSQRPLEPVQGGVKPVYGRRTIV